MIHLFNFVSCFIKYICNFEIYFLYSINYIIFDFLWGPYVSAIYIVFNIYDDDDDKVYSTYHMCGHPS